MFFSSRQKNHFSLVFSQDRVQILKLNSAGTKALAFSEIHLPDNLIQNGIVIDAPELAKIILQAKLAAKIKPNQASVGIPENKAFTKIITLPRLKGNELKEAVHWEVKSFLPSPIHQVYLDYKIISQTADKVTVLVITVPKEVIDSYLKALSLAKIKALDFETTSLSLSRLLQHNPNLNLIAAVNQHAAVLVINQGESIKASSLLNFNHDPKEIINDLVTTLKHMIEYYEEKFGHDQKITTIYLCGELVNDALQKSIETDTHKPTAILKVNLSNFPPASISHYLVPIAVAKKDIYPPKSPETINLLPPQLQLAYQKKACHQFFLQIASFFFLALLFLNTINWGFWLYLQQVISHQKQALREAQSAETAETIQLNQQVQQLNKQSQTIIQLAQKRNFPQSILADLFTSLPANLSLTSLSLDPSDNSIKLSGVAPTRQDLLLLKSQLEQNSHYQQINIPLSYFEAQENVNFTLSLIIANHQTPSDL